MSIERAKPLLEWMLTHEKTSSRSYNRVNRAYSVSELQYLFDYIMQHRPGWLTYIGSGDNLYFTIPAHMKNEVQQFLLSDQQLDQQLNQPLGLSRPNRVYKTDAVDKPSENPRPIAKSHSLSRFETISIIIGVGAILVTIILEIVKHYWK